MEPLEKEISQYEKDIERLGVRTVIKCLSSACFRFYEKEKDFRGEPVDKIYKKYWSGLVVALSNMAGG